MAFAKQGCVSDLFTAEAVYHKMCYSRFRTPLPHTTSKLTRGRPPKDAMCAFDFLCDMLKSEYENEMYTVNAQVV